MAVQIISHFTFQLLLFCSPPAYNRHIWLQWDNRKMRQWWSFPMSTTTENRLSIWIFIQSHVNGVRYRLFILLRLYFWMFSVYDVYPVLKWSQYNELIYDCVEYIYILLLSHKFRYAHVISELTATETHHCNHTLVAWIETEKKKSSLTFIAIR